MLEDSFGRWFLKVLWKIFPFAFSKNYWGNGYNEAQIFLHLIDVGVRVIYQSREILHIPEDLLSVFCTISQNSWESHLSLIKYQPISNQVSVSVYQYLSCLQENVSYHCLCLCPLVLLINIKTRHYIKFNKQQKSEWKHRLLSEVVVWKCSVEKMFLEISQNSKENTCARVSDLQLC